MDQEIKLKLIEERFTFHDIRAMTVTFMADKERVRSSKSRNVAGGDHASVKITKQVYARRDVQERIPTE